MKNMLRTISVLLCLVLALSCLAACGGKTENPTDQPTEAATEPVVIELGAVIDGVYTIVEIDSNNGTCLALLLEDEDSYRDGTYTEGREYDIDSQKLIREVKYVRDRQNRLIKVTYTDVEKQSVYKTEEYAYTAEGKLLSSASRDAKGLTINSLAYTYNEDGTYTVATSEEGRLVSIANYDKDDNVTSRTDYEYKDDGSYSLRSFENGKLTQYINYAADGSEASRAVYTYNPDGSFSVAMYENGILKNEQTGTAEEVITQPTETTTEEKVTLNTNATVTLPTEPPVTDTPTTPNNNTPTRPNNTTTPTTRPNTSTPTTRPNTTTTTTTTQPATDASGNIDMLAQSRIFRSGEYYITGLIADAGQLSKMIIAVTPSTMYASVELDFGQMMGMGSTGMSEFGFLKAADGKYYLLEPATKTCCIMDESTMSMLGGESPEEMFGDLNFTDSFIPISENASPNKTETAIVNGEAVTCYTFNAANGDYSKHYVNNKGGLVRVEDYSAGGLIANYIEIENISGNVADYMKTLPKDYTTTDLFTFLMGLIGDAGTVIQ